MENYLGIVLIASVGSQLSLSALTGYSLTSMWSMVNLIQLIQYSSMMTLYYPKIVQSLFNNLDGVNLNFDILSKIYLLHFDESKVEGRPSYDERFENQGIESTNILLNCADVFMSILLLLVYYGLMSMLKCFFNKNTPKKQNKSFAKVITSFFKKRVHEIADDLFFNDAIRVCLELYLPIFFAAVLNTKEMRWDSSIDYYRGIKNLPIFVYKN